MSTPPQKNRSNIIDLAKKVDAYGAMVRGLIARDAAAASAFHRHFGRLINSLVWRLLGADVEHDDVVHQVYINILSSIGTLRDPDLLESWVTGVTINTVRKEIRRRKFKRMLHLVPDYQEPDLTASNPERELALKRFYAIMDKMRPDERVVFSLHVIEGYSLAEIAALCRFSVPTAKRRLRAARRMFLRRASQDTFLSTWMQECDDDE